MNGSSPLDLREILWKVRHLLWVALLPIVTAACAGLLYLVITRQYEAAATVSVGEQTSVSPALEPLVGDQRGPAESSTPTVIQIDNRLHSRSFLTSIVNQLGLAHTREIRLRAAEEAQHLEGVTTDELALRRAISVVSRRIFASPVGPPARSSVTLVRISALGDDPATARQLATTVVNTLVQENAVTAREQARARGAFSADQIKIYEEKLRQSENALRQFEESVIGSQLADVPVNAQNADLARETVRTTDAEMNQIRERLRTEQLQLRGLAGVDATIPNLENGNTRALEARLKELEVNLGVADLRGAAGTGDISAQKLRIGATRQALFAAYRDLASARGGLLSDDARDLVAGIALDRSELRSLREKKDRMNAYIQSYSRGMQRSPRDQMEEQRLKDEAQRNRDLLTALQREATSSHLSEAIQESQLGFQVEVVEPALIPLTPYPTQRLIKILSSALLLGAFLSVIVVIGMVRYNASLCSLETAEEALQVKALGAIPRIEAWSPPGTFLSRNWAPVSLAIVILATAAFCVVNGSDHRGPVATGHDATTQQQ